MTKQKFHFSFVADGHHDYYFLNFEYYARKEEDVDEWEVLDILEKEYNFAFGRTETVWRNKTLNLDKCNVIMEYATDDAEYDEIRMSVNVNGVDVDIYGYHAIPYATDDIYDVTYEYEE